jgi:hypothetical protein
MAKKQAKRVLDVQMSMVPGGKKFSFDVTVGGVTETFSWTDKGGAWNGGKAAKAEAFAEKASVVFGMDDEEVEDLLDGLSSFGMALARSEEFGA